ncbi:hypothetical protein Btru_069266 [Bulinus truncatus]|nr:hypothetical protein Btru_069266 [Bulinus truncatus]
MVERSLPEVCCLQLSALPFDRLTLPFLCASGTENVFRRIQKSFENRPVDGCPAHTDLCANSVRQCIRARDVNEQNHNYPDNEVVLWDGQNEVVLWDGHNEVVVWDGQNEVVLWDGQNEVVLWGGQNEVVLWDGHNEVVVWDGQNEVVLWDGQNEVVLWGGQNEVVLWGGQIEVVVWDVNKKITIK